MVEMVIPMEDLEDPMEIRFTFKVTNIDDIPIYVKSELINPPAGWTETDEQHGVLGVGEDDYFLNDNCTRTKPATDTEESVTLRITYYSDAGYSNELGHEDVSYTITYVDFTDGSYAVVDDDGFETDLESWTKTDEVGTSEFLRHTAVSRSGVAAARHKLEAEAGVSYISKSFTISNVTRAYIRIWMYFDVGELIEGILELITDAGEVSQKRTLPIAMDSAPLGGSEMIAQWICVGAKLPVNGTYEVRLRLLSEKATGELESYVRYDDLRVIES